MLHDSAGQQHNVPRHIPIVEQYMTWEGSLTHSTRHRRVIKPDGYFLNLPTHIKILEDRYCV